MTESALRAFVERHIGPSVEWRDASWDHAESEVWRIEASGGASSRAAYLKVHRRAGKFRAESAAYAEWTCAVGEAPRLIAEQGGERSGRPHALLLEAVPGEPLLAAASALSGESLRSLYGRAGRWLGRLHALPYGDKDPLDVLGALRKRSEAWSQRARGLIDPTVIEAVHSAVAAPWPDGLPMPARVRCHRDYTARNWVTDGTAFHVIDFEHARADWALVDLERVQSSLADERDRGEMAAFDEGYAAVRGSATLEGLRSGGLLRRAALHAALCKVAWAVEHADAAFEAEGRRQLERWL